ncbi:hypothetical protein HK098_008016 [Nowakowskiella sp. JEL0407]|nr:hypothetical protein HK098_008016 [Nowakowskiella sp. JEL0407]
MADFLVVPTGSAVVDALRSHTLSKSAPLLAGKAYYMSKPQKKTGRQKHSKPSETDSDDVATPRARMPVVKVVSSQLTKSWLQRNNNAKLSIRTHQDMEDKFELTEIGEELKAKVLAGKFNDRWVVRREYICGGKRGDCIRSCGGVGSCVEDCNYENRKSKLLKMKHRCSFKVEFLVMLSNPTMVKLVFRGKHNNDPEADRVEVKNMRLSQSEKQFVLENALDSAAIVPSKTIASNLAVNRSACSGITNDPTLLQKTHLQVKSFLRNQRLSLVLKVPTAANVQRQHHFPETNIVYQNITLSNNAAPWINLLRFCKENAEKLLSVIYCDLGKYTPILPNISDSFVPENQLQLNATLTGEPTFMFASKMMQRNICYFDLTAISVDFKYTYFNRVEYGIGCICTQSESRVIPLCVILTTTESKECLKTAVNAIRRLKSCNEGCVQHVSLLEPEDRGFSRICRCKTSNNEDKNVKVVTVDTSEELIQGVKEVGAHTRVSTFHLFRNWTRKLLTARIGSLSRQRLNLTFKLMLHCSLDFDVDCRWDIEVAARLELFAKILGELAESEPNLTPIVQEDLFQFAEKALTEPYGFHPLLNRYPFHSTSNICEQFHSKLQSYYVKFSAHDLLGFAHRLLGLDFKSSKSTSILDLVSEFGAVSIKLPNKSEFEQQLDEFKNLYGARKAYQALGLVVCGQISNGPTHTFLVNKRLGEYDDCEYTFSRNSQEKKKPVSLFSIVSDPNMRMSELYSTVTNCKLDSNVGYTVRRHGEGLWQCSCMHSILQISNHFTNPCKHILAAKIIYPLDTDLLPEITRQGKSMLKQYFGKHSVLKSKDWVKAMFHILDRTKREGRSKTMFNNALLMRLIADKLLTNSTNYATILLEFKSLLAFSLSSTSIFQTLAKDHKLWKDIYLRLEFADDTFNYRIAGGRTVEELKKDMESDRWRSDILIEGVTPELSRSAWCRCAFLLASGEKPDVFMLHNMDVEREKPVRRSGHDWGPFLSNADVVESRQKQVHKNEDSSNEIEIPADTNIFAHIPRINDVKYVVSVQDNDRYDDVVKSVESFLSLPNVKDIIKFGDVVVPKSTFRGDGVCFVCIEDVLEIGLVSPPRLQQDNPRFCIIPSKADWIFKGFAPSHFAPPSFPLSYYSSVGYHCSGVVYNRTNVEYEVHFLSKKSVGTV